MVAKIISRQNLSDSEQESLIDMVCEQHSFHLIRAEFADVIHELFEDISGFEAMPPKAATFIIDQLWRIYMAKKSNTPVVEAKSERDLAPADANTPTTETVEPSVNVNDIAQADAPAVAEEATGNADQAAPADTSIVALDTPAIREAIEQGKALIATGKSKADAARAMFDKIKDETKDAIVAAFVEGASLTPKGALTYWYNCRRAASKQKKSA
jgi:hypothetical protein